MLDSNPPRLLAGTPLTHLSLYHRCQFLCGDPASYIDWGNGKTTFIVRDIEKGRALEHARATEVLSPPELAPEGTGLSDDRETATAQATAERIKRQNITCVAADRSLPFIYAEHCQQAGIKVIYDHELGVLDRRVKRDDELEALKEAQAVTEKGVEFACQTIAKAQANAQGILMLDNTELTSERVRSMTTAFLLELGYDCPNGMIIAGLPHNTDCHHAGEGPLLVDSPVIVDVFPRSQTHRYYGDCTRTVVNGTPNDTLLKMHAAVRQAKAAAEAACKPGATGHDVHQATVKTIEAAGFHVPLIAPVDEPKTPIMPHGTGHGVGLDVHEPILLAQDVKAQLLAREVLTIEPALYMAGVGGVRVEDMVVTTEDGCVSYNSLQESLDWSC